ncbi:MAG: NAD-dependent epimerase/dehydratase family protein [Maricaulaceae bacterium]
MMRPLTIAMTGGTGFLGPYLIQEAASRGHKLRVLARNPAKLSPNLGENMTIHQGSLSDIPPDFISGADVVLHMAGLIKAPTREAFFEVNGTGTGQVAALTQAHAVPRFVYLSSQAATQPQLSDYCASKRAGEIELADNYTGEAVIIRAPAVFGPGDEATAPFFAFMKRGLLPVPGGRGWRTRKLSLVYAPDLARFIIDQIEKGSIIDQPLIPASVPSLTWQDFADTAGDIMGRTIKVVPLPITILKVIAGINSALLRRLINPHLTLGKLSEFLYDDWSVAEAIESPTALKTALRETLEA